MTQLILEEAGQRRRFRMGKGTLTVGSGEAARLRLSSPQVAEIHAELEYDGQAVRLRPRPGVMPPRISGVPVTGELVLTPGKAVEIGAARLWIEREATSDVRNEPAPDDVAPAARKAEPARRAPRGTRGASGTRSRSAARGERRTGVPGWLIGVGIAAVAGLAALLLLRRVESEGSGSASMAALLVKEARRLDSTGDAAGALARLDQIPAGTLSPEGEQEVSELRAAIEARREEVARYEENQVGTRYLDAQLKKYEAHYLQGTPEKAKVRLFLERLRTFRKRWPNHPDLGWCERQEARFAGYIDLSTPLEWADVEWQVKDLTGISPRNYAAAFAIVDEFLERAKGSDATLAAGLRETMEAERAEYAVDRLYQAQHEFEKKNDPPKAVWWLVHNVIWLGDEALAEESARYLLRMPDLAGHLRGYARDYPDRYEALAANPMVRGWIEANGFQP